MVQKKRANKKTTKTHRKSSAKSRRKKKKKRRSSSLMTFKQAIEKSDEFKGKRHLLLGNGFSIALFPKIFTYGTLFERAKKSAKLTKKVSEVFDLLGTTDFERVMEALQNASALVEIYSTKTPRLVGRLTRDAEKLREVLAETISENHPVRPYGITSTQYASCKRFLSNFDDGSVYTLNYDLLLYWTLMQDEVEPAVPSDDGFRNSEGGDDDYVVWDVQNSGKQRIHYLHGALHLYDAGAELKKFVWSKTEIALVDQIKSSLKKREYPLVVTEGSSEQKMDRIQHSGFLNRAYRSFSGIGGKLFIYGHSLAENDEHLLKLIDHGKTSQIFVGIYGDPDSSPNQKVMARAHQFTEHRSKRNPAEVFFYDAETAHIWDGKKNND